VPLPDVCIHTCTPVSMVESGELVEGETDIEPQEGTPFQGILFLPQGGEEPNPYRPRKISRPTLLYLPLDSEGQPVVLAAEDELLITAAELAPWTGATEARWQVDGTPQPFGPPGSVIGIQAALVKVDD
jgi:hypothetical protein